MIKKNVQNVEQCSSVVLFSSMWWIFEWMNAVYSKTLYYLGGCHWFILDLEKQYFSLM